MEGALANREGALANMEGALVNTGVTSSADGVVTAEGALANVETDIADTPGNVNALADTIKAAIRMEHENLKSEMKVFFTDISSPLSQLNNKLDMMMNKISNLENDLAVTKRAVSELQRHSTFPVDETCVIKEEECS